MRKEQKQLLLIIETIVVCVVFASLYAIAGSEDFWGGQKWLRRFLAPALFAVWAFLRSGFNWRYFVQMPLMMGALTLPYGSESLGMKWFLRGLCGLANGASSSVVNYWDKSFLLAVFQTVLCVAISIVAGVYNPFDNAMKEQFVIALFIIAIPAFSVTLRPKVVK